MDSKESEVDFRALAGEEKGDGKALEELRYVWLGALWVGEYWERVHPRELYFLSNTPLYTAAE